MTFEQYQAKRKELFDKAQAFLNEGKLEEAKAVRGEIEKLDADFENITKELANLNAMQDKGIMADITTKSKTIENAVPVGATADMFASQPRSEADLYKNSFAKHMMGMPLSGEEDAVFGRVNTEFRNSAQTAAAHTVLVPETVVAGIWKEIGEAHPIVGDMGMTFVKGDLTIIKEKDITADAEWYDEKDKVKSDEADFGELNLTGCELSKAITISWKLKKMSIDAFLAYITTKIAEKIGNALANGVINGKGKPSATDNWKPQPQGIATALKAEASVPQIITYTDAADIDYDTIVDAMSKIKSGYLGGAAIYAKNTMIWGTLAKIKDGEERPLFIRDVTSGGVGRLFGLVVKEEDGVANGEILFGNASKGYAINVNENMTMYQEDHIKLRTTDYMGYAIVDGAVLTTKAFALITKKQVISAEEEE